MGSFSASMLELGLKLQARCVQPSLFHIPWVDVVMGSHHNLQNTQHHRVKMWFLCPAATSAAAPEHAPWSIDEDKVLVTLVKPGDSKVVMTLAEVMCSVTKERGVTEVKLIDHSLRPKVKAIPPHFQN